MARSQSPAMRSDDGSSQGSRASARVPECTWGAELEALSPLCGHHNALSLSRSSIPF